MKYVVDYVGERDDVATALERHLEGRSGAFRVRRLADVETLLADDGGAAANCVVCEFGAVDRADDDVVDAILRADADRPVVVWDDEAAAAAGSRATAVAPAEYVPASEDGDRVAGLADRVAMRARTHGENALRARIVADLPGMAYQSRLEEGWPMSYVGGDCRGLTGYPAAAFLDGDVSFEDDLIHPDDRRRVRRAVLDGLESGDGFDVEYRLVTKSGAVKWVWEQGYRAEDGPTDRIDGHIFDVTEQRDRRRELDLKNRAMDEATTGILITDPSQSDNPIVYANEAFVELTGYERDAILGRNCRFLQGPGTDPGTVATMRAAIDAGRPVTVTVLNYRRGGTAFWNRVRITPLYDDDGTVTHFLGFQRDVTDQIERRQRLQLLYRVLRHNVRNNMNYLLGWLEQVEADRTLDAATLAEMQTAGRELVDLSDRARELEDLLADPHRIETRDLGTLVDAAVAEVVATYPEADVDASVPDGVSVLVDGRIDAAIRELLTNAIVHDDGRTPGVSIVVDGADDRGDDERVRERRGIDRAGDVEPVDVVRLTVRDRGPSIPESDRRVLADGEETPLRHGDGLGLWLVHWLVTISGGTIRVADRDPRGNAVTIELVRAN